jgi:hypothetical protein
MRDKLIHGYFGVNLKRVWGTVMIDLPPLTGVVVRMLAENVDTVMPEDIGAKKSKVGGILKASKSVSLDEMETAIRARDSKP